jgi:tRNA(Arg) A34 adenosine deaminase TadA
MESMKFSERDECFMRQALLLAEQAARLGEVPVGAVLVLNDQIIGQGYNQPITECDSTAHAELVALREGCRSQANYRLPGAVLYVTLEPCTMCAGALVHGRIAEVVFAAAEPKAGAIISQQRFFESHFLNHGVRWRSGLLADESAALLRAFFQARRKQTD